MSVPLRLRFTTAGLLLTTVYWLSQPVESLPPTRHGLWNTLPSYRTQNPLELGCTRGEAPSPNPPVDVLIVVDASANGRLYAGEEDVRLQLLQHVLAYLAVDSLGRGEENTINLNAVGVLAYNSTIFPLTTNPANSSLFEWKVVFPSLQGLETLTAPTLRVDSSKPGSQTRAALLAAYDQLLERRLNGHSPLLIYIGSLADGYANNTEDTEALSAEVAGLAAEWKDRAEVNRFSPFLVAWLTKGGDKDPSWISEIWQEHFFNEIPLANPELEPFLSIVENSQVAGSVFQLLERFAPSMTPLYGAVTEKDFAGEVFPVSVGFLKSSPQITITGRGERSTLDSQNPTSLLTIYTIDPATAPKVAFKIGGKGSNDEVHWVIHRTSVEWDVDVSPRVISPGIPITVELSPSRPVANSDLPIVLFQDQAYELAPIGEMFSAKIDTGSLTDPKDHSILIRLHPSANRVPVEEGDRVLTCTFRVSSPPRIARVNLVPEYPEPGTQVQVQVQLEHLSLGDEIVLRGTFEPYALEGIQQNAISLSRMAADAGLQASETLWFEWPDFPSTPIQGDVALTLRGVSANGLIVEQSFVLQARTVRQPSVVVVMNWWRGEFLPRWEVRGTGLLLTFGGFGILFVVAIILLLVATRGDDHSSSPLALHFGMGILLGGICILIVLILASVLGLAWLEQAANTVQLAGWVISLLFGWLSGRLKLHELQRFWRILAGVLSVLAYTGLLLYHMIATWSAPV